MLSLLLTCVVSVAAPSQAESEPEADNQAEAKDAQAIAQKEVANYMIHLGADASTGLKLEETPVLRWTNHLRRRFYGDVYVWTRNGRPEVVASITNVYGSRHSAEAELHSLSLDQPKLERSGKLVWQPSRAGVAFTPIPAAPTPAKQAAARLRQLQAMSSQFSASAKYEEGRWDLRLLSKPLFRHASSDPAILDGALFAFVKGTDPDVFLLIEARSVPEGFQWQFAVARFSGAAELRVAHGETEVWRAEQLPSRTVYDAREPYFGLRIETNEGNSDNR